MKLHSFATNRTLLTFDDGFKSNKDVALNILSKKNIKALKFPISKNRKKEQNHKYINSDISYSSLHEIITRLIITQNLTCTKL